MVAFIENHHGVISDPNTEIVSVGTAVKIVTNSHGGESHEYQRLIWAADQKALYRNIDAEKLVDPRVRSYHIRNRRALIAGQMRE